MIGVLDTANQQGGKMSTRQDLSDSLENYLEVILELEETNKVARAKEIADKLFVSLETINGAPNHKTLDISKIRLY